MQSSSKFILFTIENVITIIYYRIKKKHDVLTDNISAQWLGIDIAVTTNILLRNLFTRKFKGQKEDKR